MDREAAKKALQSAKATGFFTEMYGDGAAENEKRYEHVLEGFEKSFGGDQVSLFTSAGRTEISGNHTDHNNGCLLYTSAPEILAGKLPPRNGSRRRLWSSTMRS